MTINVIYFQDYKLSPNPNTYNIFFVKAGWCPPCKATYNFLFADKSQFFSLLNSNSAIKSVIQNKSLSHITVNVVIVDLDVHQGFNADRYGVRQIPSWVITDNKEISLSLTSGAILNNQQFDDKFQKFLATIITAHSKS